MRELSRTLHVEIMRINETDRFVHIPCANEQFDGEFSAIGHGKGQCRDCGNLIVWDSILQSEDREAIIESSRIGRLFR
jgi:hypothetical protein